MLTWGENRDEQLWQQSNCRALGLVFKSEGHRFKSCQENSNFLFVNVLKQLYYTLIYPYLNYGIMSFGAAYKTKLTRIQTKQNQCVRGIFFSCKRESAKIYYLKF